MQKIITRFAPSPTGHLHIGGLRTALFNYLFAKKHKGEFLLRIEDTDLARNSEEATQAILEAFKWVGLKHDREIEYQSKRFDIYKSYIQKLLESNKAYYCYMTKEELEELRKEQEAKKQTPRYDNRYRDFNGTPPHNSPVVRIKAPLKGTIEFHDGIKGKMRFDASEVDDFIIARSDGSPTYNFVVAIDDALMGVSHIIRGDDHLSNTPKQIVIYNALDFKIPEFFHVPMILGSDGAKLSKRHGALSVMEYKNAGYLPESLLNFLVRLGWSCGDEEIFSLIEMIEKFDTTHLSTSPSQYNSEKFLWLNAHYIKACEDSRLKQLLCELDLDLTPILSKLNETQLQTLFNEIKTRVHTLLEACKMIKEIFHPQENFDAKLFAQFDSSYKAILDNIEEQLISADLSNLDKIKDFLHISAENLAIKPKNLMPLLRLALLKKGGGIGVAEALLILGSKESTHRIKKLKTSLQ